MTSGTANWETFSEMAFQFRVTPLLMLIGTILAMVMGIVGGFLPAWRASRTTIAQALREL
jgi:putative ABC transport system permease protein